MGTTELTGQIVPTIDEPTLEFRPSARPLIDLSEEEQDRRMALAAEAVAAMEAIEDDPAEDDREFLRALDEAHPGGLNLGRYYADGPGPA